MQYEYSGFRSQHERETSSGHDVLLRQPESCQGDCPGRAQRESTPSRPEPGTADPQAHGHPHGSSHRAHCSGPHRTLAIVQHVSGDEDRAGRLQ